MLEQNGIALIDSIVSCESGYLGGFVIPERTWVANAPGMHVFTVSLDPDAETQESTRSDNQATATLHVVP
ncbi:MAG TPA: hypothetical protein VFP58_09575 [Candidatus Eisenbacteria bacterium]|nr:hypothetical protein [Candidatus Eisenbacteria bacterium]